MRATKEVLGWDPDPHSSCPTASTRTFARASAARPRSAEWQARFDGLARRRRRRAPRSGTARGSGRPLPGLAEALPQSTGRKDKLATARRRPEGDGRVRAVRADDGRRRRRPQRSRRRPSSRGEDERYTTRAAGAQRLLGRARARHGRRRQRHGAHGGIVRPYGSTFLLFADYMRGVDPPLRADGHADPVGLHPRLGRARRGRPDPPAGRAPRGAAGDPGPDRAAPGRRRRDRRGLARDPRGPRGPGGDRALAPGPAGARRIAGRRRRPRRLRAARGRGRRGGRRRHGLGGRTPRWRHRAAGRRGRAVRVVSMPSWELFAAAGPRLPRLRPAAGLPKVSVEAGHRRGWSPWVDASCRSTASAPAHRAPRSWRARDHGRGRDRAVKSLL